MAEADISNRGKGVIPATPVKANGSPPEGQNDPGNKSHLRVEAIADLVGSLPPAEREALLKKLQGGVRGHADSLDAVVAQRSALKARVLQQLSVLNLVSSPAEALIGKSPFEQELTDLRNAANDLDNGTADLGKVEAMLACIEATQETVVAQEEARKAVEKARSLAVLHAVVKGVIDSLKDDR